MGGCPDIPHVDMPHAVLELADLPHIHPAPVLPDFDLVIGPDPDPLSTFRVWLFRNDTELNKINILQRNILEKRPLRG